MTRIGIPDVTPVAAAVLTPRGLLLMGRAGMPQRIAAEDPWPRFVGAWVHTDYPRRQPYVQQSVNRPDLTGADGNRPTASALDGVGSDLWYVIYARS